MWSSIASIEVGVEMKKRRAIGAGVAINVCFAFLLPVVLVSSAVFAETIKKKGAFGTNVELKLIGKSYVEALGGVSAESALDRAAEFARSIEGASVQVLDGKAVKAKGKMRCKMPWSFGATIDSEFQFELDVKGAGEKLAIEFSHVLVEPRHPDLPQGIEKFAKACLDPSRDALMKVIAR